MIKRIPIADRLSLSRVTLTLALAVAFILGWHAYAVAFFALGWATDLVDGYFAREQGSWRDTRPNLDMDGICDSILAFGASGVVVLYGWHHYHQPVAWLLVGLYLLTIITGVTMVLVMGRSQKQPWMNALIAFNMIVMHGFIQIVATGAWFAYMAFGQLGIMAALAIGLLVAAVQWPKMQLWLQGRFA